jgi:C1A family cysteine protease
MTKHGKKHQGDEYHYRFGVYLQNKEFIELHNASESTLRLGINKFADMSNEEFRSLFTKKQVLSNPRQLETATGENDREIPKHVDWRTKYVISPVLNQGLCNAGWSFSAADAISAVYAIKTGKQVNFSAQQLIDCSLGFGNDGCEGG